MIPMMIELMKYGVGAFKQARTLEGALDQAVEQLKQAQGQQKPNPEMMKVQAQQQADQQKMQMQAQLEQAKQQMMQQTEAAKLQHEAQLEQMRQQHETQMKAQELAQKEQFDRWKAELDAATKIMVARISANPGLDIPALEAQQAVSEKIAQDLGGNVSQAINHMAALHNDMANMHGEAMRRVGEVMDTLKAPKRIIRGADGRAVGVEPVQQVIPGMEQATMQ
jgi:DNA repair exonuclease SbcCD ATPase subunit